MQYLKVLFIVIQFKYSFSLQKLLSFTPKSVNQITKHNALVYKQHHESKNGSNIFLRLLAPGALKLWC